MILIHIDYQKSHLLIKEISASHQEIEIIAT
jgi:hypothetical protein